jgi:hypothetical protein
VSGPKRTVGALVFSFAVYVLVGPHALGSWILAMEKLEKEKKAKGKLVPARPPWKLERVG